MSKTIIKETGASGRTFFSSKIFLTDKKILKLSDIEHCEFHSMNVLLDTFPFLRAFLSVTIPSVQSMKSQHTLSTELHWHAKRITEQTFTMCSSCEQMSETNDTEPLCTTLVLLTLTQFYFSHNLADGTSFGYN